MHTERMNEMDRVFSRDEINTGRQREYDYLKGIFMLFIYLIHAFQATMSPEDSLMQWIYMFATMSGAAIFIFVMGFGTVYSRNAAPAHFIRSGVRMIIYQYLNNLAYVAALLLPYPFVSGKLSESMLENFKFVVKMYIQYTNIFFITGIIYLVLALLKRLHLKAVWYAVIGAALGIAAPFLFDRPVHVPVLGYILKLLIGDAEFVSFTPLYFLPYALLGVAFGQILRHVKEKVKFYKLLSILCIAVIFVWWTLVFVNYGSDQAGMWSMMCEAYPKPNLWHMVASLAHILLFAAIIFFVERGGQAKNEPGEPKNPFARQLLYYSRHISKYYAMHILVYFIAYGFHGYEGFESYQCWLLALLSMIVTELLVRGYNYFYDRFVKKKRMAHGC